MFEKKDEGVPSDKAKAEYYKRNVTRIDAIVWYESRRYSFSIVFCYILWRYVTINKTSKQIKQYKQTNKQKVNTYEPSKQMNLMNWFARKQNKKGTKYKIT